MNELEYTAKDILDQDIPFEILPEARSAPLNCPECGESMVVVETTRTIMRGRFTIPYKVYECPTCERRYLNPEQADHFRAIQRFPTTSFAPSNDFRRILLRHPTTSSNFFGAI